MTQLNIPYNFQNQTTSDANQVDQNFNAVANVVNGKLADDNMTPNSLTSASIATEGIVASDTINVMYAQDLFSSSMILSGGVATKDGTNANQVDVTSPILGWVKQSDESYRRLSVAVTNYKTTIANTTYYLDLGADGIVYWAQAHPSVNYATIATVTSDASANVNVITDTRNIVHTILGDFFRTDANAPNPQTVTNPAKFSNIGIGISPAAPFHIYDSSSDTVALIDADNVNTRDPLIAFRRSSTTVWSVGIDQNDSNKFKFSNGGQFNNFGTSDKFTLDSLGNATFVGNVSANGINGTAQAQINYSGSPGSLNASTTTTLTVVTGLPTYAKSFALAWKGIYNSTAKGLGLVNGNQSNSSSANASNISSPPWTISSVSLSNGTLTMTINNADAVTYSAGTWTLDVWGMVL